VLVLALPLSCDGKTETADQGAAGASGASAGRGGGGSGGKAGSAGSGGNAGSGSGGRAGNGASGGSDTAGRSAGGRGGSTSTGGTGGRPAGAGGGAGDAVGGEAGAPNDDTVTWDGDGFISADSNAFGIQGAWFFETDCAEAMPAGLPCTTPNFELQGPDMLPGWSATTARVCAKGVAPQVINDQNGMPAYLLQWGARLGFELNAAGSGTRQPFDAAEQGIKGFAFDIITQTTPPQPADMRINVITTGTDENPHFVTVILPAANLYVLLDDALQGSWVTMPVVLDETELTAITVQVYTNATAPKPFDFCVSNLRVVR
jgi:hypothetical protein